jgi:hypothetical protein
MGQQEKDVEMVGAQRKWTSRSEGPWSKELPEDRRISASDSERWGQTRTATTSTMETQAWDESDGELLPREQAIVYKVS